MAARVDQSGGPVGRGSRWCSTARRSGGREQPANGRAPPPSPGRPPRIRPAGGTGVGRGRGRVPGGSAPRRRAVPGRGKPGRRQPQGRCPGFRVVRGVGASVRTSDRPAPDTARRPRRPGSRSPVASRSRSSPGLTATPSRASAPPPCSRLRARLDQGVRHGPDPGLDDPVRKSLRARPAAEGVDQQQLEEQALLGPEVGEPREPPPLRPLGIAPRPPRPSRPPARSRSSTAPVTATSRPSRDPKW